MNFCQASILGFRPLFSPTGNQYIPVKWVLISVTFTSKCGIFKSKLSTSVNNYPSFIISDYLMKLDQRSTQRLSLPSAALTLIMGSERYRKPYPTMLCIVVMSLTQQLEGKSQTSYISLTEISLSPKTVFLQTMPSS